MAVNNFNIGAGTKVTFYPLELGVITEPLPAIITSGAASTPVIAAKGVTTIPISAALAAGVFIPAGTFLGFRSPAGKEVLVLLTADAVAADTDLTVAATPAAIAIGSIANYPLTIANRTSLDLDRSGNMASQVTFDDKGYETSLNASKSASFSIPGAWSQLDPGYNTIERLWGLDLQIFAILQFIKPNPDYSRGKIIKGVFNIESVPISIPSDGIITGDITLMLSGEPTTLPALPTV